MLEENFLERFFPYNRFMEARNLIAVLSQDSSESLNEAKERFKSILRKCQGHGFDELTQISISFAMDSNHNLKLYWMLPRVVFLTSKNAEEIITIIDRITLNNHQGQHN